MGHGLLPVVKEGVRSPDLTGKQVVQGENLHWSVELQPLVPPALAEEDVDGVLLENTVTEVGWLDSRKKDTKTLAAEKEMIKR